jgi:hypothetical protein
VRTGELGRLIEGLRARRSGAGWIARCPAHDDRTPSLSLALTEAHGEGRVLVHCFGGCTQADIIDALGRRGLWPRPEPRARRIRKPAAGDKGTRDLGLRLWAEARPLHDGSWPAILLNYFQSRGLAPFEPCTALRFHPRLPHKRGIALPALLALATDGDGRPAAVQATWLRADGGGKANVEPARKTFGRVAGAAVRLTEGDDVLLVGEGVESVLSVAQALGEGGYALLGTGGLRSIVLPEVYRDRRVIVAADNDESGAGQKAAHAAARRLVEEQGFLDVRIALPPRAGMDFNDFLRSVA